VSKQTPKDRYDHDPTYRRMTDLMESMLVAYQFTPSEMREMAIMASMHFEMRYGMRTYFQSVPSKVNEAFKQLEEFRVTSEAERKKKEEERKAKELEDVASLKDGIPVCTCVKKGLKNPASHNIGCVLRQHADDKLKEEAS